MVRATSSPGSAIELARRAAGLDKKEVYLALKIDPGTWSKIEDSAASLPTNKIREFCDEVGNRIYVEWINFQVGCTAVMIKSEAERVIDDLQARLKLSEQENAVLMKAIRAGAAQ
ncbi:MAG: transcriptional regulator [Gammaproteobacteria bacterium]|nr:transcriptional regulator [Gammaproteobacteria bacterium]